MIFTRLVVILLFVSSGVIAQDPYEKFVKSFAASYENQHYEAIYNLTNDAFKEKVTKEQVAQVLAATFTVAGKIKEIKQFESTADGNTFHVVCERDTFALFVGLDASGKAAGLYIRPVAHGPSDSQSLINKWKGNAANAGLVIGRIRNGQPDIQFLGVANKATSLPLDAMSIFELGSISKPFTGILLHMMIVEGKISLDDPVNKFLPASSYLPKVKDKDILIRHLITHSSCLPRMPSNFNPPAAEASNPYHHYSEKELLASLPQISTGDCEVGISPAYSNLGAGLLGYILTKISGKPYTNMVNDGIAKPLKTKSFGVIGESDKWTQGYALGGAPQQQWTFTDALVGAGGLDACADDLVKILSFLMKPDQSSLGKAVAASAAIQLAGPQGAFATFWIHTPAGQKTIVFHNGLTGGFNAFVGWIDGTQTGVFILSNNGVDVATQLGLTILTEESE